MPISAQIKLYSNVTLNNLFDIYFKCLICCGKYIFLLTDLNATLITAFKYPYLLAMRL